MPALEARGGVELEVSKERARAQGPGRSEGIARRELEAPLGDQRRRVGLGGDVVLQLD